MPAEVGIIDGLADVVIGGGVDILTDVEIITLEFAVAAACDVDVLTGVWAVAIIKVVNDFVFDVFTDVNVKGLAAIMTALEFALSAP